MAPTTAPATSAGSALLDERIDDVERAALSAGDRLAWERQYRAIHAPLYGYCLRLAGDESAALDLVQEAFVRTMQRCRTAGAPDGLRAYLFTAARNLHLDAARRSGRTGAGTVDDIAETAVDHDVALRDADPDTGALVAEQRDDVRAALADLPDRQRQALALCDMEGCSYAQVAEALDLNENAVAQLVFRARGKLRLALRLRQVDETRLAEDCRANLEPISRLIDGQLKDPARGELTDHLAGCADCTRVREEFSLVQKRYRAFAPALPFAFMEDDAWAHVLTRSERLAGTARRISRRAALLVATTVLVLFVFAGTLAAGGGGGDETRIVQASGSERETAGDERLVEGDPAARTTTSRGSTPRRATGAADAGTEPEADDEQQDQDDQRTRGEGRAPDTGSTKPPKHPKPKRPGTGSGGSSDTSDGTADGGDEPAADPAPVTEPATQPQPAPDPEPTPPPPPGPPNLVATGASWTGSGVSVSFTNTGETTAGANTVRVQIGRRVYSASAGALAPGQSSSVSVYTGCLEGSFSFTAMVDATGAIAETSEGDNSTSGSADAIC